MPDDIEDRLAAVERALTEADTDLPELADDAELTKRVDELERELDAVDERIEELDAALQAVRGYVGSIRSVNEDVEARANAAVAGVESLEDRVDALEARNEEGTTAERSAWTEPSADPSTDQTAPDAGPADGAAATAAAHGSDASDADDPGVVERLRDAL